MTTPTWEALVDPNRRQVLNLLRQRPRSVNELSAALRMSQPNTSKHLRVLRMAGLVRVSPEGQQRLYSIDPRPLAELDAWLEPYRQLWENSLDALGRHLDRMKENS